MIVPGNHDVPLYRLRERVFDPYQWYTEFIADKLDYILPLDNVVFVALNSTSPLRALVNGRIEDHQLDFCTRAFQSTPDDTIKLVVAHHPVVCSNRDGRCDSDEL